MPVDHSDMKLGKNDPLRLPTLFQAAKYIDTTAAPTPPPSVDYTAKVMSAGGYPTLLNNKIGDCVPVGGFNTLRNWVVNNGGVYMPTDAMAQAAYTAVAGYNPNDPSTDRGTNEESFLEYWRTTGIGHTDLDQAHKLFAYMAFNIEDHDQLLAHTKLSVWLFGVAYLGLALPVSAQQQDVWGEGTAEGDTTPGSWGGHCVPIMAFDDAAQRFVVPTWGALKSMTYDFYVQYVDEGYALLGPEWADPANQAKAPSGFDFTTLNSDLGLAA